MQINKLLLYALICYTFCNTYSADKVILPDYPYTGNTYSGYLNIGLTSKRLHYLFVESQNKPDTDPLLLWLNGGPGCSSLLGWCQEHGPAIFEEESTEFKLNPYSWNKNANVIYLESPAGVGFSYCNDNDIDTDDTKSANDNLQALLAFFDKFPKYLRNDFYISGESYAGIYVPFLAYFVTQYNEGPSSRKINLKGILVGNGVTDWKLDTEPALYDFAYTHALYSHELRDQFNNKCNSTQNLECDDIKTEIGNLVGAVNIYDIYRKCFMGQGKFNKNSNTFTNNNYTPWLFKKSNKKHSKKGKYFLEDHPIRKTKLGETPPCTDSLGPDTYLNRQDVKQAMNVKMDINWSLCSESVQNHYTMDMEKGSYWIYPILISKKLKILIYTGDTDGAVPFNGTLAWVRNLGLKITRPWRTWRVNEDAVAGYVTNYDGLILVTVKGTGHMVPQWKAKEAFYMLNQFFEGKDL